MTYTDPMMHGLPDPDDDADLYEDVVTKRLLAWVIDVVLISVLVGIFAIFTLLTALFFLPLVFAMFSFAYRWLTLSVGSATPGMWLMAINLRDRNGDRFDAPTAFLHTAGYTISVITVPLQVVSVAMMLTTPRRQGLTDSILGTVALNRAVR